MTIRVCKDCRWYRRGGSRWSNMCVAPARTTFDVVHGRYHVDRKCAVARKDREDCGLGARWFEQRVTWWDRMLQCIKKVL